MVARIIFTARTARGLKSWIQLLKSANVSTAERNFTEARGREGARIAHMRQGEKMEGDAGRTEWRARSEALTDARCGEEYTVTSGRQKYCSSACQRIGVLAWQREHKRQYNKTSGQDIKKRERREGKEKICIYCHQPFKSKTASGFCSDYCRKEQAKITQCKADIKRGYKRDIDKYLDQRDKYREQVSKHGK